MEEIVYRLSDLREDYREAQKRLKGQHPTWDEDHDVRLTTFSKIANVLNCGTLSTPGC